MFPQGFSPKHAIPLSNVTVFGGSLSNYFLNQPKRHPECNRPLIDWDLILVMQPMTLAGALLGSFINKLLPELFLTVSLVTLLVYTCKETLEKGFRAYAAESKAKEKAAAAARESELSRLARAGDELTGDEKQALMAEERAEAGGAGLAAGGAGGGYSSGSARELEAMLQEETIVPWWKVSTRPGDGVCLMAVKRSPALQSLVGQLRHATCLACWQVGALWAVFGAVILVNLLKGGGGFPSPVGISCGSTGYWASTAAMFAWILIVSYFVREYLIDITARRRRIGYRYQVLRNRLAHSRALVSGVPVGMSWCHVSPRTHTCSFSVGVAQAGDIRWDERATVVYPLICIVAGMCAGMFGIGGGIVQVPLMLHLGVNPKVASATSATMIMFTSFTALTSFYVFGLLLEDYAAVGFVMGLGVTVLGQVGLNMLIKKLGRDSLIVFSVAAVVGVSAMLMGTHSLISVSSKAVDLSIGQVCDAGEPGSE